MPEPLERLLRVIDVHVEDAMIDVYNELEGWSACAGIKDDEENSMKAKANHYGHPGLKGSWVPARTYITNAVSGGGGRHKKMPEADVALRRVVMDVFRDSVKRWRHSVDYKHTSYGSNKAFGTSNSPKKVLKAVAQQMLANQLMALDNVVPKNTKYTLRKKKKRSTQPLVDYGEMKGATRCWVEHDGEEEE